MAEVKKVKKPVIKKPARSFKDRVTNPKFIIAVAGFAYTIYNRVALQYGLPAVQPGDFQLAVDLFAYLLIGTGVYSTFTKKI